jgi:D-glycero-D-manno-heptose 1,7-bisphosphate phosphatase
MFPALFLDRDGVVIENRDAYVRSWEDVVFIPGALESLVKINKSDHRIVVVTNQSAVGRGIITLERANEINQFFLKEIQKWGGRIDQIYICPHSPDDHCSCRKPLPGLLFQAAHELSLNLSQSILIGDALSDLAAGQAAGLGRTILVRTGRGNVELQSPLAKSLGSFEVYPSLADVLEKLLPVLLPTIN